MRVYLNADIEGTCGIADWAETERATMDDYRPFAAQMTAEVAAACEGAVAAGAEEIVVKDAHDSARNLDGSRLPRPASSSSTPTPPGTAACRCPSCPGTRPCVVSPAI